MKNLIIITFLTLIGSLSAFAQDCALPVENGQKYMLQSISYETPIGTDVAKYMKLKASKQDAMVANHNAKVEAGKMKSKFTYDMVYEVQDLQKSEGYTYAKMVTKINNVEYASHMICESDTLYLMRKEGIQEMQSPQGAFTGYSVLGVQVLPRNIKVGDRLPVYIDNTYTTQENKIKVNKVNSISRGSWKTTITYSVHDVLEVSSSHTETFHYMASEVTGTREFKLNGKTYTAYIIASESWTKTYQQNDYSSDDGEINTVKMRKKVNKLLENTRSKTERKTRANEYGYTVTPRTEWYVPELGIVNLVVHSFGFLVNETKLVGIE